MVQRDIIEQLGIEDPVLVRGSFFRPNLRLWSYQKGGARPTGARVPPVGEAIRRVVLRRLPSTEK